MDLGKFLSDASKAVQEAGSKISNMTIDATDKLSKAVTTESTFLVGSVANMDDGFAKTLNDLGAVCKTVEVQSIVYTGTMFNYVIKVTK
jgi:hypothetical protein